MVYHLYLGTHKLLVLWFSISSMSVSRASLNTSFSSLTPYCPINSPTKKQKEASSKIQITILDFIIEMFYLNTIEQLFLFVEQLFQLEVCLPYSRLLAGIPILAVFQNLRWNSNKTPLSWIGTPGSHNSFQGKIWGT